jgi:Rrf2 family protein
VKHLSTLPKGELGTINSIAAAESISRTFLAYILRDLTRSGILMSVQGVSGGYRLAGAPKDVSLLDIIEAIEGPIHINLCTEGDRCPCGVASDCSMRSFWIDQEKSFKKALGKHTFARYRMASKVE